MRAVVKAGILLAVLFCAAVFAGGPALAAAVPLSGSASGSLNQDAEGIWTVTAYLDSAALCSDKPAVALISVASDGTAGPPVAAPQPELLALFGQCPSPAAVPALETQTVVSLTFPVSGVPQSAVLVVTAASPTSPLPIPLTVHRYLSPNQYVWIPVGCGIGLAVLLAILTAVSVGRISKAETPGNKDGFWQTKLYATSTWSFSDSWATNFTALVTLTAGLSAGVGAATGLIPGVDITRFSLLFVLAGGITGVAPIIFGWLNDRYGKPDPLTGGTATVMARHVAQSVNPDEMTGPDTPLVTVTLPAGGTITLHGDVRAAGRGSLAAGTALPLDIGTTITVLQGQPPGDDPRQPVLAIPGTTDLAIYGGRSVRLSAPVSALITPPHAGEPHPPGVRVDPVRGLIEAGTDLTASAGARLSYTGRADIWVTGLSCAEIEVKSDDPAAATLLPDSHPRSFEVPYSTEVVATRMWVMLAASCVTVFGIGAQIGIVGWVLGINLAAMAPQARAVVVIATIVTPVVFILYSVRSILSLIEVPASKVPRRGQATSFML